MDNLRKLAKEMEKVLEKGDRTRRDCFRKDKGAKYSMHAMESTEKQYTAPFVLSLAAENAVRRTA